jgi:hypothetical protein
MFHKDSQEFKILSRLNTPQKIQTFLDEMPLNFENDGETCMSPLRVLRERKAHCIEGAFLAGVCLMLQGEKPLIVSLKVEKDDVDHIVTIFKRNEHYGAISKTNHFVLRYRDPVYRSVRELAMSYFHEYFLTKNGKKTFIGYTEPINLNRFGTRWITAEDDLWDIAEQIYDAPITQVVSKENRKILRPACAFEQKVASIQEWEE